ncbi:MAG: hypothetical protein PHS77_10405 [Gallionellaceae bacterium]|nr:hypothetical protein [Gallionellaceae bacterium]
MKIWQTTCLLAAGLLSAQVQASEVLVTLVKDTDCRYLDNGAWPAMVPFMKLNSGDRLKIGPACTVQLLYTANGRQETWVGSAEVVVGETASQAEGGAQPAVRQMPTAALARLARTPALLTDMRARTGMVMVRSGGMLEKLRDIEALYEDMRAAALPEDVTPELYLVSALYELELYRDVEEIIADIVARQPDNAEAQAILDNLRRVLNRANGTCYSQ